MVPLRYPAYVAVGLTVAVYGICYAIAEPHSHGAVVTALPGGWLAAHGLLNGVLAAVREGRDGSNDSDPNSGSDDGDDGDDSDDGDRRPPDSAVELAGRVPLQ